MAYPSSKGPRIGEKAKRPKPGIPLKKDDIAKLLIEEHGNLSRVADRMGTTRTAVRNRINADPQLKEVLDEARERKLDRLEHSVWLRAEESNDTGLQCFILKTQGRHRGYDQDDMRNAAKDIATAAFDFIVNKSKNPAEPSTAV
jgi:hypothetical protein